MLSNLSCPTYKRCFNFDRGNLRSFHEFHEFEIIITYSEINIYYAYTEARSQHNQLKCFSPNPDSTFHPNDFCNAT